MPDARRPAYQAAALVVVGLGRVLPGVRALVRDPRVRRFGFRVATAAGLAWGVALGTGRVRREGDLVVCAGLPHWAFGRGGTTVGAVYLTRSTLSRRVLEHEAVHVEQWRTWGLALPLLYAAEGPNPLTNRFEIEAGLTKGGYR
jgi:hypothetical protein